MIKVIGNYYILKTDHTSYVFKVDEVLHLVHLHYGGIVSEDEASLKALEENFHTPLGNGLYYDDKHKEMFEEVTPFEVSTFGKGDLRNPMVEIEGKDGLRTNDFTFVSASTVKPLDYKTLPSVKDDLNEGETLLVNLLDKVQGIELRIAYTVFSKDDVITRKTWIKNLSEGEIKLIRAFSLNLDLRNDDYYLKSFHGHWANEMLEYNQKIVIGRLINESLAGTSSNRTNPLILLYKGGTTEEVGKVYGFNLLYSGNHQESLEADIFNNLRVLIGMNPATFSWSLKKDEEFEVPEAIMSFSEKGFTGLSLNFQHFVRNHIIEEAFRSCPRKVLNNSWEACYFNFNQKKLLSMVRLGKKLGIELFVLDDGWFGKRNNDTKGLGDWNDNLKKLPEGLSGLAKKINKLGMKFGIWVEPEMVNEDSNLFRSHPEWALMYDNLTQSKGRNQMILDLSNPEVINYLDDSISSVIERSRAYYVKWDMNRCFSDYYSLTLDKSKMAELHTRYYLGLYELLRRLKKKFPEVLFEGCASGGNRFDLGILSYMPEIWASDNQDPFVRLNMQYNYSYGYPMSSLGCHVGSTPSMQTLRRSSLSNRFNVALYGAFGYELDLREETIKSRKIIKNEIEFYKKHRSEIFNSDFYRLKRKDNEIAVMAVSFDKTFAVLTDQLTTMKPINPYSNLPIFGLGDDKFYHVKGEREDFGIRLLGGMVNYVLPIHIKDGGILQYLLDKAYHMHDPKFDRVISGTTLNSHGLVPEQNYTGAGFTFKERIMKDFSSKLYIFSEVNK